MSRKMHSILPRAVTNLPVGPDPVISGSVRLHRLHSFFPSYTTYELSFPNDVAARPDRDLLEAGRFRGSPMLGTRLCPALAQHPLVGRIVAENPFPLGAGHDIEIVEIVAVRRADGMVAPRHQDDIAVIDADRLIEGAIVSVDALESEAL